MKTPALADLSPYDLCVGKLLCYARAHYPGYQMGAHHRRIAGKLQALERRRIHRLMIEAPPRHGKTMLVGQYFPAWYLGRNPGHSVISATYSQERANDVGRLVRNLVADDVHRAVFRDGLSEDSSAAHRFSTAQGSSYFSVGRGGPITGRGAHLMLIDDPLKDREEADSDAVRRQLRDWYSSVIYTRLMPDAVIVLIMTRWADEDLAGWLLAEFPDEGWERLRLPALAEDDDPLGRAPGKALWPERYDEAALARIQAAMLPRDWHAMYQQSPVAEQGGFFQRDWFQWYDTAPEQLHVYGASDYAVTPDAGDYTEHGVVGLDADGRLYVLDWWSGQTTAETWIESQLDLVRKWRPLMWWGESGVIRRSIESWLVRRMRERRDYVAVEWLPTGAGSKAVRARSFQAMAASGMVYLPRGRAWARELAEQLIRFPAAKDDDKVDVCGLIGRGVKKMTDAHRRREPEPEVKPYTWDWLVSQDKPEKSPYRI